MLATQCSKPAAMKAEIGNMRATILSVTDRPAYASHTAKQTTKLHRTPYLALYDDEPLLMVALGISIAATLLGAACAVYSTWTK